MKRVKLYGILLMAGLFIVGCSQNNDTATKNSEATSQSETESKTTNDQSDESAEAETSEQLGTLAKDYINLFNSGHYYMRTRTTKTDDTGKMMDIEATTIVSDGKTAYTSTVDGVETQMIMMDGKVYAIDHMNRMVRVMSETDSALSGIGNNAMPMMGDLEFVGNGKEDGLTYEEYRSASGMHMFYYFDGKNLKKIKTVDGDSVNMMDILELSGNVPADSFTIPKDYQQQMMN